jgi:hypothetical protein
MTKYFCNHHFLSLFMNIFTKQIGIFNILMLLDWRRDNFNIFQINYDLNEGNLLLNFIFQFFDKQKELSFSLFM